MNMVEAAKDYMSEGKKVFYVVGLAHMLGETGIVNQLQLDGYIVEQIMYTSSRL